MEALRGHGHSSVLTIDLIQPIPERISFEDSVNFDCPGSVEVEDVSSGIDVSSRLVGRIEVQEPVEIRASACRPT